MRLPAFVCLSVCWQDYSKTLAWLWMKEELRVNRCRDMDELINF